MNDEIDNALAALKSRLSERMRCLNREIAGYPRPIARCDVQLTKLLDERTRVRSQLDRLATSALGERTADDGAWLRRVEQCVVEWESADDDEVESAICGELRTAVRRNLETLDQRSSAEAG